jgi:hypothetical protein
MITVSENHVEKVIFDEIPIIDYDLCVFEYGLWEYGFSCSLETANGLGLLSWSN